MISGSLLTASHDNNNDDVDNNDSVGGSDSVDDGNGNNGIGGSDGDNKIESGNDNDIMLVGL